MSVLLITSLGNLHFDLYYKDCPLTTKNFLKLCKIKYYNNKLFYRVQKDFIAQSGSPENNDTSSQNKSIYGLLNPQNPKSNFFKSEILPKYQHNQKGLLATANIGPDLNTSTFYITLTSNNLLSLNNKHTIFGILTKGFDVLDKINEAYVDEDNRPFRNIRILHTIVFNDPFDDLDGMEKLIPEKSPEYKPDLSDNKHLEDDFDMDKFFEEYDTDEKIKEKLREQESKNKAVMLELMEDLPNSNVKPPENVLFVCRLNPVTQAKDLENIFGQFGEIKDCKIVRDKKTKQSLRYGFIEFAKVEDCGNAYNKMNGALIDDYRIKIDFSQSVKKMGGDRGDKDERYGQNKNSKKNKKDEDEEEKEMIFESKNRYNKYKDKELHIMNDEIHYKFEKTGYRNNRKNAQYVFENQKNDNDKKEIIKHDNKNEKSSSESETVSLHNSKSKSKSRSRSRERYKDNIYKNKYKYYDNEKNKDKHRHERGYYDEIRYKKYDYKYKNKYK